MYKDPVIELYKRHIDRTLIRENLKLTVEERLLNLQNFIECLEEFRVAGEKLREGSRAMAENSLAGC